MQEPVAEPTVSGHDDEHDDHDYEDWDETFAEPASTSVHAMSGITKFRKSGAGAILNGVALGLRDVFDPTIREEAPIIQEAPGEPDVPRQVDAHLDPDEPEKSSVTVRPWLFDGHEDHR